MQGWSDSPLTASGKSDAHNAGIYLRDTQFQAVYSSDTMRAIKTAKTLWTKVTFQPLNVGHPSISANIFTGILKATIRIEHGL
nr:phosphoglycerate mutase family protein [Lacticaseibacillus paracasei]